MAKINQVDFARQAAYIASRASSWAGGCLILPEELNRPMTEDALRRFTDSILAQLEYINEDRP